MKQFSLTLLVATFFCLTISTFAQEIATQTSKAKPIRIDQLPKGKLPIPEGVGVLGASSYEFLIAPTGTITINLYDNINKQIVNVEVQESIAEKTLLYKIKANNNEEWLRIQTQEHENSVSFFATSSSGVEMNVKAQTEKVKNQGKFRVKGVSLSNESGTKTFLLNESNLIESRLAIQNALQAEEQKLFTTTSLQKLKEFMQNFGKLKDAALSKWSGQEKVVTNCKQENPSFTEVEIEPVGCSGSATCFRMSTIVPVFTCTSTSPNCGGMYIIYDCVVNIICTQSCSSLNGCA